MEKIEIVRNYVYANMATEITLDSMAAVVGLSKFALTRLFHRNNLGSPVKWMWDQRISMALVLVLENPDRQLTEIMAEVGFNSAQHFSRYFKKVYGVSASEMRAQVKSDVKSA